VAKAPTSKYSTPRNAPTAARVAARQRVNDMHKSLIARPKRSRFDVDMDLPIPDKELESLELIRTLGWVNGSGVGSRSYD